MKKLFILITISLTFISGKEKEVSPLVQLNREIESLNWIKAENLNKLERKEATRWDARYKNKVSLENQEVTIRKLENNYSRLTTRLSQKQEELIRAENETRLIKSKQEDMRNRIEVFKQQVSHSMDKVLEQSARDIPIGITERLLTLSKLKEQLDAPHSNLAVGLKGFLDYKQNRYHLTETQEIKTVETQFGEQVTQAWQLRLGTVFVGEQDKQQNNRVQLLLRTGKLTGKVFVWRQDLKKEYAENLRTALQQSITGSKQINLTLDVLQNKSWGSGYTSSDEKTFSQSVVLWFAEGGLVMYPLLLTAFIGLLLALERLFFFIKKSTGGSSLSQKVLVLVEQRNWDAAISLCKKSGTSISRVLENILSQAEFKRIAGEKAGKEALLREVPALEKRMGFLAAIGGAAPLMGLLGTVSGMISLFQIITDVGTNDPKILAGGISEALVTTQTGLIIAIPILLVHGYLSDRIERIQNEITSKSFEVLNKIWPEGVKKEGSK